MRSKVNRTLLGLAGLALLVIGLAVLAGSLDLWRRWGIGPPSWWPYGGSGDVLLSDADRTRYTGDGWWWPAVFAGLGLALALLLWWLFAQFGNRRLRSVLVDSGDDEGAVLRGRTLEDVLSAEAREFEGVDRARTRLTGRRSVPEARMTLGLAPHAQPEAVVTDLDTVVLERARTSAGLEELPAEVRLRKVKHQAQRVS